MFRNEENHRVFAVHCSPEQSRGVRRRAGNHNVETRIMREHRLIRLAVPQTSARQIRAVRSINHRRTFPVAEGSPPQVGDISNELIETRINKIDELQFEDWPFPVRSQSARDTENRGFSER